MAGPLITPGYYNSRDSTMNQFRNYFRPADKPAERKNSVPVSEFIDLTSDDSFEISPKYTSTPAVTKQGLTTRDNNPATTVSKPVDATSSTKTLGMKLGTVASYLPLVASGSTTAKKSLEKAVMDLMPLGRPSPPQAPFTGKPGTTVTSNANDNARRDTERLAQEILNLKEKMRQTNKMLTSNNLESLPDKGIKLQLKFSNMKMELNTLHRQYKIAMEKAQKAVVPAESFKPSFESLPTAKPYRRPGTVMVAESLTGDALVRLHSSLKSCPIESGSSDPGPRGLTIPLMPHQQKAMAWLLWREKQHPKGGILADDMGLGKTLTMIALVLRSKELMKDNQENLNTSVDRSLPKGGTLVVCPLSVLRQWEDEIKQRCERKLLRTLVYHDKERNVDVGTLTRRDIVLTTYNIVGRESQGPRTEAVLEGLEPSQPQGLLFSVCWERVILDEAHTVRNPKTVAAKGVCQLRSTYRWCLTGTPVHNKLLDIYSLLCFLKFTPFNNEQVWRRCAENKSAEGIQRLNAIMKTILLRRTKEELQQEGKLQCLPSKEIKTIQVTLEAEEDKVYQHLLKQSQSLMARFIMQKAERQVETGEDPFAIEKAVRMMQEQGINVKKTHHANEERVQASHILLQLLRLRQICCHPFLAKSKIDGEDVANDGIEGADDIMNMVANMERLNIEEKNIRAVLRLVREIRDRGEKVVLVSQWTSMLDIVKNHLRAIGIRSTLFTGKLNPRDRQDIITAFNQEHSGPSVLLLSLTAGGTGVNLIGGNNMLLMDIHWNPQLEAQAMDRIYRVGQKKDVKVYRFICSHTVEQSIVLIQEKKLQIAAGILNAKNKSKLDFEDLKMLFMSI
ncbi:hypothetical protein B566_EDAN012021 [Ephemera danica]|nr:hypothetical protein B566_EDAN012021 [Ephemera danica]